MQFVVDFNSNTMIGEDRVLSRRQGTLGETEQYLYRGLQVVLAAIDSVEVDAVVELIAFPSYTAWVGKADYWSTCRDL